MHSVGRIPRYPMRRCDGTDVKTAETALQRAVVQGVTALRLKMAGQTKSPHRAERNFMNAILNIFGEYGQHITVVFLVIFLASFSLEEGPRARFLQWVAGGFFLLTLLLGLGCSLSSL